VPSSVPLDAFALGASATDLAVELVTFTDCATVVVVVVVGGGTVVEGAGLSVVEVAAFVVEVVAFVVELVETEALGGAFVLVSVKTSTRSSSGLDHMTK